MTTKEEKEAFYMGHSGTSALHVLILLLVPTLTLIVHRAMIVLMKTKFGVRVENWNGFWRSLLEFGTIAVPTLLSFTVGEAYVWWMVAGLAGVCGLLALGKDGPIALENLRDSSKEYGSRIPAVTLFRGGMLLGTCIAILAVDFQVFPRSLAKCETTGTSLMDVGVGAFVFAAGLVAPGFSSRPMLEEVMQTVKVAGPLLGLGFARWLSVRLSNYHEHVSEYGRDLNFFFVLAFVGIGFVPVRRLAGLFGKEWHGFGLLVCGLVVLGAYQSALRSESVREVLEGERGDGFLIANREGLAATCGYVGLFAISNAMGTVIKSVKSYSRVLGYLVGWVVLLWGYTLYFNRENIDEVLGGYVPSFLVPSPVSRALANLPYVVWVLAVCTTLLTLFFLADATIPTTDDSLLAKGLNNHGLSMFLIANVATGLVNKFVDTVAADDTTAMAILSLYILGLTMIAVLWRTSSPKQKK